MSKLGLQALRDFERLLMVAGEHTWGWNGGDVRLHSWSNPELRRSLRNDEQFRTAVVGWIEQQQPQAAASGGAPAVVVEVGCGAGVALRQLGRESPRPSLPSRDYVPISTDFTVLKDTYDRSC